MHSLTPLETLERSAFAIGFIVLIAFLLASSVGPADVFEAERRACSERCDGDVRRWETAHYGAPSCECRGEP
jgi:hypothetical protein